MSEITMNDHGLDIARAAFEKHSVSVSEIASHDYVPPGIGILLIPLLFSTLIILAFASVYNKRKTKGVGKHQNQLAEWGRPANGDQDE